MSYRKFDFSHAKVKSERLGRRVHVIVPLTDMLTESERGSNDKKTMAHAIEYIKKLEARVAHLESAYAECGFVPVSPAFDVVPRLAGATAFTSAARVMAAGDDMAASVNDPIDPVEFIKSRGWNVEPIYIKVK